VFFDCHVAPQPGWHNSFLQLIAVNYRRMVVPQITALDVNTWTQVSSGGGMAKCYLTWDADFKWFDSDDMYIAVISGGLLGMSRRWWLETGGYDREMMGWGGENLDQSLRVWLCGGEIVNARDSQVAHMWRTGDAKTRARYKHVGDTNRNRARAVFAWYGEFAQKLMHYPAFAQRGMHGWYGDLSSFEAVKSQLNGCRPFAWFLRRFKAIYENAGLIPREIFMIREMGSGKCLKYLRPAGTSPDGYGMAALLPCQKEDHRFYWHLGNKDKHEGGKCCSGIHAWNTDQCIDSASDGKVRTYICDVSGRRQQQYWRLENGQLRRGKSCIGYFGSLSESRCSGGGTWEKLEAEEPLEMQLYKKAQREHPETFGSLGLQDG